MTNSSNGPIVWVAKAPRNMDLSAADRWGQVIRVFSDDVRPYDIEEHQHVFDLAVLPAASATDRILVAGPRAALCSFITLWVTRFGYANLLVFSARTGEYIERRVPSGK